MNTFYIVRHGETENNKAKRFSGWIDTPLTEDGISHARAAGAKLQGIHLDQIISSDLGRAFGTAYEISRVVAFTGQITRDKGLREANYGDYANLPYSQAPKITPEENTTFVWPGGGESLMQMQVRVLACVRNIDASNHGKTILLVAHDGTINSIRENFTRETMGQADTVHNAHDSVWRFTITDGSITSFKEFIGASTASTA